MKPRCPACRNKHFSPTSSHIQALYQRTFYFHFENLRYANGRHNTFLCYQVEKMVHGIPVPLYSGIFMNKDTLHAELCFFYWFHDHVLLHNKAYRVTWYMSWSPCSHCAEQMVSILAAHRNVSLTIFSARFYYFWRFEFQQGLRRLKQEGVSLAPMSYKEFLSCWDMFVYNEGKSFRPWKRLNINFRILASQLHEILSVTLNLMSEEVFQVQFDNHRKVQRPFCRRKTYVCYQLQWPGDRNPLRGCLQNKKGEHAEIRFVNQIRSLELDQAQITCYLTWSPCPQCAQELAALKKDHPHLVLRIVTSRLYFHWIRAFQEGLCHLCSSGVQLGVMDLQDFTDCWVTFVSQQKPFEAWDKLEEHSQSINRRLQRILRS